MAHSMTVAANPMSSSLPLQTLASGTSKLKAAETNGGTGTGSSASTSSTDSIGSTFLSLLVQELQNQDPTAPMDSTAMVGQMISLNQLDQLTSINQTLGNAYGGASSTASATGTQSTSGGGSGASAQAANSTATAAALRLLASRGVTSQPSVSTSVALPSF